MKFFKRHILTIIALVIYWPAIFIATHIPLTIPSLLFEFRISDKILHFAAYFILVFLLWFTINPNKKVNWKKAVVWWILLVVVWYGVFDEWLQGYVGRNPNIQDFMADLAGAVAALLILTVFNFWTAAIICTAGGIFIFTTLIRTNNGSLLILPSSIILLLTYMLLTTLWLRWMYHFTPIKINESKWIFGALGLPLLFLIVTDSFSLLIIKNFSVLNTVFSVLGIAAVVFSVYLFPKIRREIS